MGGNIPKRDLKILCSRSGNRCAMPTCRTKLVADKTDNDRDSIIGEVAHIKGEKPSSARYDSSMTDQDRNCYDNLIFVCGNCHKIIDDQPNTYTVEKLHYMKSNVIMKCG